MNDLPLSASSASARRLVGGLAVLLAAATGSLLTAGCASNSSAPAVAHVNTTTTTTSGQSTSPPGSGDPTAYAACMRRHGVPNFPDPGPGAVRVDKSHENSPRLKAADDACKRFRLAEGTGPSPQQRAEALRLGLRYAACMRRHGVPNFPDPVVTSDGLINIPTNVHLDEDSPRFRTAEEACKDLGRAAKGTLGGPVGGQGSTP